MSSQKSRMSLTQAELAEARNLWETTELTAAQIAAHFTDKPKPITRNMISGYASRYKWLARGERGDKGPPPRTLYQRLDELNAKFEAVKNMTYAKRVE